MPTLRRLTFATAAFLSPLAAFAHPGHDGDHELTWDFGHFAAHPLATLAAVSLLVTAGWAVARLLASFRQPQPRRIRRDDR